MVGWLVGERVEVSRANLACGHSCLSAPTVGVIYNLSCVFSFFFSF